LRRTRVCAFADAEMQDSAITTPQTSNRRATTAGRARRGKAIRNLERWLKDRTTDLREMWVHEIRARGPGGDPSEVDLVVGEFAVQLLKMLPLLLGPSREQIEPLWDRAAGLYGVVAAKRGLAAGEAIEEIHILRELVIRELYRDPPANPDDPLSLRDVLRLNRALDRAVTHASVGHMDALFFEIFEGESGPSPMLSGDDVATEATAQLNQIQSEVGAIVLYAEDGGAPAGRGH
jgi:hypothetical protein